MGNKNWDVKFRVRLIVPNLISAGVCINNTRALESSLPTMSTDPLTSAVWSADGCETDTGRGSLRVKPKEERRMSYRIKIWLKSAERH